MEDYINDGGLPQKNNSKAGMYILLVILSLLNLPAIIVGSIIYLIFFRSLKWKPTITSILIFILSLLWYILVKATNPFSIFVISQPKTWFIPYMFLNVILGLFGGLIFIFWRANQLKTYPELKEMHGWAKDFSYADTPLEIIKRKKLAQECREGKSNSYEAAPMGVLEEPVKLSGEEIYDKYHTVYRYYSEAYKSTLITGGTGSGKTLTMLNLMRNDILAGYPICVIDFKKGPDMAYFLSKWAKENNRRFYHFTSGDVGTYKNPFCEHQASYDPLSTGTGTSKADMMLNLRKWDGASEVYKGRTQSILQAIFYLLENVDKNTLPRIPWEQGGIAQFVAALEVSNLFDLIEEYKKELSVTNPSSGDIRRLQELQNLYKDLTSGNRSLLKEQLDGLSIICRTLILSNYSDWLSKGETPNHINLFEIAASKDAPIVLFQFNPNEEPEFAKYMGSIIMSDLSRASAYKQAQGNKTPFGLYVDETQILDPADITGIVEKARSAMFFSTFSAQSLEQLVKGGGGEDVLNGILDTVSNFIVHSGSSEDSALRYSKIVGKDKVTSYRVTGRRNSNIFAANFSNSRQSMVNKETSYEYRILPKEFQELSSPSGSNGYKSTAYYITKQCSEPSLSANSGAIARKFQSVVDDEILEPVPEDFKRNLLTAGISEKRTLSVREIEEIENIDEVLLQDNNFKIEEVEDEDSLDIYEEQIKKEEQEEQVEENIGSNFFLNSNANLLRQQSMTPKQLAKENKRESLEPKRKKTSFELMQEKRGVKPVNNTQEKKNKGFNGLPKIE